MLSIPEEEILDCFKYNSNCVFKCNKFNYPIMQTIFPIVQRTANVAMPPEPFKKAANAKQDSTQPICNQH